MIELAIKYYMNDTINITKLYLIIFSKAIFMACLKNRARTRLCNLMRPVWWCRPTFVAGSIDAFVSFGMKPWSFAGIHMHSNDFVLASEIQHV